MKTKNQYVILILVLIFGLGSCNQKTENKATKEELKAEPVRIMELQTQLVANELELTSTLVAYKEVHLAPAQPGRIENINVEVGSTFRTGDILFTMDQTQLIQARIQLKSLELDYNRLAALKKTGSIAQQQYDQIAAQLEIAQKNVAFLESNSNLRAPFNGVVSGKYFENGEMFSGAPNTTAGKAAIVSLVQINPLKAIVNVNERNFNRVKINMPVEIKADNIETTISGQVIRIYPVIDPLTRTFKIEVNVPNSNQILRPGMFCRANFAFDKTEAILVPSSAVLKLQGSNDRYVFIEENGVAHRKSVNIGRRFDDKIEIISDEIKPGARLIVSGQTRLLDKMKVEVKSN